MSYVSAFTSGYGPAEVTWLYVFCILFTSFSSLVHRAAFHAAEVPGVGRVALPGPEEEEEKEEEEEGEPDAEWRKR